MALYKSHFWYTLAYEKRPMLPLQLQPESHVPLYIQIRDQMRALVHSGELRAGDRIPASRELATQLGVHRTTVANAYAELESEGLIQGHVGRGTFILANSKVVSTMTAPPAVRNGGVRWESLFADERGEEALSRLLPDVPGKAISFATAKPAIERMNACWRRMRLMSGIESADTHSWSPTSRYSRSRERTYASASGPLSRLQPGNAIFRLVFWSRAGYGK